MSGHSVLILDMLARGPGKRLSTLDVLGAGPRTIAGVLEKHGVDPIVVPGEVFLENPQVARGFSALFISGMSVDLMGAERAIRLWRRHSHGPVVAGGPMAQEARRLLEKGADLVVVGEAEETLDELLSKGLLDQPLTQDELEEVRGVAFLARGPRRLVYTGRRPPLASEKLARYWASANVVEHYPGYWYMRVYVEVVRGCSNIQVPEPPVPGLRISPKPGCAYCSVVSLWGPARSMPRERVVREVRELVERGVRRVVLSGPDILDYGREGPEGGGFASNPEEPPPNLGALEGLFKDLYRIPEVASGEVVLMAENTKPTTVTRESARLLGYYLEGTPIHMGVESGDDELLRKMARPGGVRRALEAVRLLSANHLRPYVYLIYGLPGQRRESIEKTLALIDELEKIGVEKITLYRFTPLPETAYENMEPGDPSDPWNRRLIERVGEFNVRSKERLVGKKINAIIVGRRGDSLVAYPLRHGPVILVDQVRRSSKKPVGRKAKILVTSVKGERLVRGRVLTLGRRVLRPSLWERPGILEKMLGTVHAVGGGFGRTSRKSGKALDVG